MDLPPLDLRLTIHPRVSVRPEPFGALLYHFGTRQLSFLKDRTLLGIVQSLDGDRSLGEAIELEGVTPDRVDRYRRAIGTLMASSMLVPAARTEAAA